VSEELRLCLGEILGSPVPVASDSSVEPLRFYSQWLAERNLGLVPIADPASFDWPGKWLAIAGGHAVVMFGSPSGVWLDPAGSFTSNADIEAGWIVAALDVNLPTVAPYGTAAGAGEVAAILIAPDAEAPLHRVDRAKALVGKGLEGDRYANGIGTFNAPGRGYQLTLIEAEVLDEIGLAWEEARRNVVVTGISLNALVGERFHIGAVECIGRRLAEPCAHLERVVRPGLLRPLVHRGGLRADVLSGGIISVGDRIS
jgi:hypothetical protein